MENNQVPKKCGVGGCTTRPSYGPDGGEATTCKTHAEEGWVDVVSPRCDHPGCDTMASYGPKGGEATRCAKHRDEDMFYLKRQPCQHPECLTIPSYGNEWGKPLYCVTHAEPDMKDVVSKRCGRCGLFQVNNKEERCSYCREDSLAYQKTREKAVYDLLKSTQDLRNFVYNKSIGYSCGNFRPDLLYDLGTHRIIVECDEEQHRGYEPECERIRMLNILNADLTPCVFIRYNPDAFKIGDETKRISKDKRQAILLETIREHLRPPESESIDVIYLFYDGAEIRRTMLTEDY